MPSSRGSNLGVLHCRQFLYCLNQQGKSHHALFSAQTEILLLAPDLIQMPCAFTKVLYPQSP